MANNRFHHIPYEVEAMRLLDGNITEIIQWLGPDFVELHNQPSYMFGNTQVTIPERNEVYGTLSLIVSYRDPTDSAQILYGVVYNGDIIVRERDHTYAVYTLPVFNQFFAPVEEFELDEIDELEDPAPVADLDEDDLPVDNLEELDEGSELPYDPENDNVRGMDVEELFNMSAGLNLAPMDNAD